MDDEIFDNQKECVEIQKLGFHRESKCYIMSNGLFTPEGAFLAIDELGVVSYEHYHFFIPAFSKVTISGEEYEAQRKFKHFEKNQISFNEWASIFTELFEKNGMVGIVFGLGTIFSDVILKQTDFFPLLFNFGVPGSGKSTMTYSLMHLFGKKQNEINISGSSTIKGKMATFAQFENAIVHLEEYKNASAIKDVEIYKGIYNRHARVTKSYSNDSRTNVSPILSTTVICGQEKPICEEAFYTRCILLTYYERKFNFELYNNLKKIQDKGITSVLLEIYKYRSLFEENYEENFTPILSEIKSEMKNKSMKERLMLNSATLLAVYKTLESKLNFPFTYKTLYDYLIDIMESQNKEFGTGLELQKFWETIESCIDKTKTISTPNDFVIDKQDGLLYLRMAAIYPAYAKEYKNINHSQSNAMDRKSLNFYLETNNSYVKKKDSHRFGNTITNALVLDYNKLINQGVNLEREGNVIDIQRNLNTNSIEDLIRQMDTDKPLSTNELIELLTKKADELKRKAEIGDTDELPF